MRPLRYSINVTLDGCCDHTAVTPEIEMHRHAAEIIASSDALLLGRITYGMMESAWRVSPNGRKPDWTESWMDAFIDAIDPAKKYVVSDTLTEVDWNAEIIRGADLEQTVRALKQQPGNSLYVGGVTLPKALAELGLIDEFEMIVHPVIAGHGPTPFAGLSRPLNLELVGRKEFASGAVSLRYKLKG